MQPILSRTSPSTAALHLSVRRLLPLWLALLMLALAPLGALGRDLWTDEAFTVSYLAHDNLAALIDDVRKNEETPLIYFVAIWGWSRIWGTSELAARSFSLLCGMLAIASFTAMARRWLSDNETLVAGAVFAASPLVLSYLVEARGYTLTLLLVVLCIAAFERAHREPERWSALLIYALSAAALFLTSYFGIVLLAAHNLLWLLLLLRERHRLWQRLWRWCAVQAGIGSLLLPWLPILLYQMKVAPAVTSFWGSGVSDYYWLALSLLNGAPLRALWRIPWLLTAALTWGLITVALVDPRHRMDGLLLRCFGAPALMMALMVVLLQVIAPRYLIVLAPGAALGVALGFGILHRRRPRVALALLVLILAGLFLLRFSNPPASNATQPWSALVQQVAQEADPAGDVVLFHPPWDQRIFAYYYHGPDLPLLGAQHYDEFYYEQGYDLRRTWTTAEALPVTSGYQRVWIFYNQTFHTVPKLALPYTQIGHWSSGGLELFLYEVRH